jgi:hypothetical protein
MESSQEKMAHTKIFLDENEKPAQAAKARTGNPATVFSCQEYLSEKNDEPPFFQAEYDYTGTKADKPRSFSNLTAF